MHHLHEPNINQLIWCQILKCMTSNKILIQEIVHSETAGFCSTVM